MIRFREASKTHPEKQPLENPGKLGRQGARETVLEVFGKKDPGQRIPKGT